MAATVERAACVDDVAGDEKELEIERVHTPGTKTIEAVAEFLGVDEKKTIKALLFDTYDENGKHKEYVAAFIRGDRELNMTKLVNVLGIPEHAIEFADEEKMGAATGAVGGFTGPLGLHECRIIADSEIVEAKNLCAGACEKDYHIKNVNYKRDYEADDVADIKLIKESDKCPQCLVFPQTSAQQNF